MRAAPAARGRHVKNEVRYNFVQTNAAGPTPHLDRKASCPMDGALLLSGARSLVGQLKWPMESFLKDLRIMRNTLQQLRPYHALLRART